MGTATDTRYNGWTNYETCAANLWLSNNEGSQRYWAGAAEEALTDTVDEEDACNPKDATYTLSKALEDAHLEEMPELPSSLYSDLLTSALQAVNWYEIAEHMIADASEGRA